MSETSLLELEAQGEICSILDYWEEEEYLEFDKKRPEAFSFLHRYKSKKN